MTFLLAMLVALVAFSLMTTVLVASTRPLRMNDEPILGRGPAARAPARRSAPRWTDVEFEPTRPDATQAPRPPVRARPEYSLPTQVASRGSETMGTRATPPNLVSRPSGRINPNTWGRVRAEIDALKTVAHARNAG